MISDVHKSIFVRIPKNASSSICSNIGKLDFHKIDLSCSKPHWDNGKYKMGVARRVRDLYADAWPEYFKFAFVRNPWDRMVSSWAWITKTNKVSMDMSFKNFVMRYPFKHPGADWHSMPQHTHIYENQNLMVDFVGRFENLEADFQKVCGMINIKYERLPHKKKTDHKPYWEHYDAKTKKICANIFKEDIRLFGYKFRG